MQTIAEIKPKKPKGFPIFLTQAKFVEKNKCKLKRGKEDTDTQFEIWRNEKHEPNLLRSWETASGGQLIKARKYVGLTQAEVGRYAGVSQASVSNYENGAVRKNAAFFDVDVEERLRKYFEQEWHVLFLRDGDISILQDKIV